MPQSDGSVDLSNKILQTLGLSKDTNVIAVHIKLDNLNAVPRVTLEIYRLSGDKTCINCAMEFGS